MQARAYGYPFYSRDRSVATLVTTVEVLVFGPAPTCE